MYKFPDQPAKIKAHIRSYERKLRQEAEATGGFISDGYGKRYLLGPLYMLLGDNAGAIKSIAIYHQLQSERPGPKRSELVREASKLHKAESP